MAQASVMRLVFLALIPLPLPTLAILLMGGVVAFLLTYLLTFAVRALCYKLNWLDKPADRRVHSVPVPRLGGVAMFIAFVIASLLFYTPALNTPKTLYDEGSVYWLFLIAGTLVVIVHFIDDIKGVSPLIKIIVQTVAVIILLAPGRTSFHGIFLFSFNNPLYPWFGNYYLHLFVDDNLIRWAAIPAVLFTWLWIVGMMNTVNLIDGVDGLATGVVGITALITAIISWSLHQESIAILAAIFTGAVFGFLPHNWNPAKIFMGDTGSMFLGLGLAVFSTVGGAKLALAFMVLGVPILDVAVVAINRMRRGQRPWHYDKTHLHHRLMATGLSVRQICYLFYAVTLAFGLLALNLTGLRNYAHIAKVIGILLVMLFMAGLIVWIDYRQRQRGVRIKLGGTPAPSGGVSIETPLPILEEQEIGLEPQADEVLIKKQTDPELPSSALINGPIL